MTELNDTAAGKFTATYDNEGRLASESLPDGITAKVVYNPVGEAAEIEYHKANNCGASCTWFDDYATPSIHGQWLLQISSLVGSTQHKVNYAYDATGRLTEVQDTPPGKGCTARVYAYDSDGNRTSITTRPPNAEGKCISTGGTSESHLYDTADRLMDAGVEYNPFGDITGLAAGDAGGTKLTTKFYVDGQTQNQTQGEQTIGYNLDPGRRISETVSTGKVTATEIQHYPGPGTTSSWSNEPSGNWTRYIGGISGLVDAIQHNGETPILQLGNLHGDIVATAYNSETASTLASTIGEASEWGIPATETPPKYSWLGAHELPTELPSGIASMGARSYIPTIGRFIQPDPSPGGSGDVYAYTYGNPVNETDLSGAWTLNETSGGLSAVSEGTGTQVVEGVAAGAIMPLPVNVQIEAAFQANPPWDQITAGTEEYEEYEEEWEEEGDYEYASYHDGGDAEYGTGHTEEGMLYQPLVEDANIGVNEADMSLGVNGFDGGSGVVRDVKGGPGGGCARTKNCSRQHKIWSKAGSGGGPSIEEEARKFWHQLKCEIMIAGQLGAEETTIGHAMAEHGELKRRKC